MLTPRALTLVGLLLLGAHSAHANAIPGLFDTGVDDLGAALAAGSVDPHYTLIISADPSYPGPNAIVAGTIPSGYWIANTAGSKWIAPAIDEGYPAGGTPHPQGAYTYRLFFDLTGIDPATVSISGTGGADNSGIVQLNGVTIGTGLPSYNPLTAFSASSGFLPGLNHLDFVVTNLSASGSNPTGIRVQGLTGTGTATTGVGDHVAPPTLELSAPFPNPGRGLAHVAFSLPQSGRVQLRIHDLAGRTVRTIADRLAPAGMQEATWDGADAAGAPSRSGVYFVELEANGRRVARRLVWMN